MALKFRTNLVFLLFCDFESCTYGAANEVKDKTVAGNAYFVSADETTGDAKD